MHTALSTLNLLIRSICVLDWFLRAQVINIRTTAAHFATVSVEIDSSNAALPVGYASEGYWLPRFLGAARIGGSSPGPLCLTSCYQPPGRVYCQSVETVVEGPLSLCHEQAAIFLIFLSNGWLSDDPNPSACCWRFSSVN